MIQLHPPVNNTERITLAALKEANEKHASVFNSAHEGYAVLKEELEECQEALLILQEHFECLWEQIKADEPEAGLSAQLNKMQPAAHQLITEASHASAMVMKLHAFVRTQIAKKENVDM